MGESVLVTGGAGFIGSHLTDALLARGDRVRVLDNLLPQAHPTGKPRFLSREAELVVGDIRDGAVVARALEGIEVVHHLAGMVGNGQSMLDIHRYTDVNVSGSAVLLEALVARKASVRRLVFASSMVVYGDGAYACAEHGTLGRVERSTARLEARRWEPVCPTCGAEVQPIPTRETHSLAPTSTYGTSKRAQEELLLVLARAHRLPTVGLRYLNVYGSRQALSNPYTGVAAIMATRFLNDKPPLIFEDGGQLRDLNHVSDIVRANLAASSASSAADYLAFNVGSGRSVSILEIARALGRALGKEIEPEVTGQFREGDIRHCFADVDLARRLLAWESAVPFEEGCAELAAWAAGERPSDRLEESHEELRRQGMIR